MLVRLAALMLLVSAPAWAQAQVSDTLDCVLPSLEARANPADGTTYNPCLASTNPERRLKEVRLYYWTMGQPIPTVPVLVHQVGHQEGQPHTFIFSTPDVPRNYAATAVDSSGNESCRMTIAVGAWPVDVPYQPPLGPVGHLATLIAHRPYKPIEGAALFSLVGERVPEAVRSGIFFERDNGGRWWRRVLVLP